MNTVTLDLLGDYAVNIGSTYKVSIQLCNAPDLTQYTGSCQVRQNNTSTEIILEPTISVVTKDIFNIVIPYTAFTTSVMAGNYQYDVLFTKSDNSEKFYPIAGKVQLIKRITVTV